jgi:hypothetical protein
MFIYAGVPCETYSIAGRTNRNRDLHKTVHGYNTRNTDTERTPCCPEGVMCKYADQARLHDSIVQHVLHALQAGYKRGFRTVPFRDRKPRWGPETQTIHGGTTMAPGSAQSVSPIPLLRIQTQSQVANVVLDTHARLLPCRYHR